MRRLMSVLAWLIPGAMAWAVPVVDQSHVVTQSVGGRIIFAGNSPAQTFTAGATGLLSQVDVLLRRDSGDVGELALELWPVVAGGPAGSTPLFSMPIDPTDVPTGSPAYVAIDVTAGGLAVAPGDQYAIAVSGSAALGTPTASWTRGFPGYDGGGTFDRAGSWAIDSSDFDYGFRTWIDPDLIPGELLTLEMTPNAEWSASLSTSGASVISTATNSMRVQRLPTLDEDHRGLIEFDATGLPAGATLRSAKLEFDINGLTQSSLADPVVALYGYHATGVPTDADIRSLSRLLGQSVPIGDFDGVSIGLDVAELASMLETSPGIGIVAYGAVPNLGVNIVASQLANSFPMFYSPATLTIGYSFDAEPPAASYPAQGLPAGDYNGDAHVDAADYTVWRDVLGTLGDSPADGNGDGKVDQDDYGLWAAAFGVQPDGQVRNGNFETGDLSHWNVVIEPNTHVSFGFPRVESFDVDGDGQATSAMRVRLGRSDTSQFGGTVAIEQQVLLAAGDYIFSADVASQSLEFGGNTGPGNYELTFDGQIVDQVMLNGTLIGSSEVIRDRLQATLTNVEAGYHTLRLAVSRGATNSREIYQFIDNIQLARVVVASTLAVPEPAGGALWCLALTLVAGRPRRPTWAFAGFRSA